MYVGLLTYMYNKGNKMYFPGYSQEKVSLKMWKEYAQKSTFELKDVRFLTRGFFLCVINKLWGHRQCVSCRFMLWKWIMRTIMCENGN